MRTATATAPPEPPRPTSQARIDANRLNALRSTGPRTDEGKKRSRLNALKHGLTAASDASDADGSDREARREALRLRVGRVDTWADWAVDHVAMLSTRIDRAGRMIWAAQASSELRAEDVDAWELDRTRDAAILGSGIADDPARVVAALLETPQGIDWLVGRWAALASSAERDQPWTEAEERLALDLMQVPAESRWMSPAEAFALIDPASKPMPRPAEVARAMVDRLETARPGAVEYDEVRRLAAAAGVAEPSTGEIPRLQRYERDLYRRIRSLLAELAKRRDADRDEPSPAEAPPTPTPAPKPIAGPEPTPGRPGDETNPTANAPVARFQLVEPPKPDQIDPIPPGRPAQGRRPNPDRLLGKGRKRRRRA